VRGERGRPEARAAGALVSYHGGKLRPATPNHKIYSFRHMFEDRLKEAGIDDELRRLLMGHAIDRPKYGSGGSLEWRQTELRKIELAFDPSIV
jgi:hypothetical protein